MECILTGFFIGMIGFIISKLVYMLINMEIEIRAMEKGFKK